MKNKDLVKLLCMVMHLVSVWCFLVGGLLMEEYSYMVPGFILQFAAWFAAYEQKKIKDKKNKVETPKEKTTIEMPGFLKKAIAWFNE